MAPHRQARILVLDDEASIVRALARLLQREGYTVATASNGRQALALLHAHGYDVLLTDLRMPELDGQAFYARVRHQYPALRHRVIFSHRGERRGGQPGVFAAVWPTLVAQALPHHGAPRAIAQVLRSVAPVPCQPVRLRGTVHVYDRQDVAWVVF